MDQRLTLTLSNCGRGGVRFNLFCRQIQSELWRFLDGSGGGAKIWRSIFAGAHKAIPKVGPRVASVWAYTLNDKASNGGQFYHLVSLWDESHPIVSRLPSAAKACSMAC